MKNYGIILSEKRIKVFLSLFYILKKHEIEKKNESILMLKVDICK